MYRGASTIMRKVFDWNSYAGSGSRTPELYPVSPDWLEYGFTDERFVACCEG
jgi:hypothetical protein